MSFRCSRCGAEHPGPPMAYSSTAPARWYTLPDAEREAGRLEGELCLISPGECFVRANLEIPLLEAEEGPMVFSAWVQVDQRVMRTILERWEEPDRISDPGYPGLLANDLPGYPPTLGMKVELHMLEPGVRARMVPLPSDHPLATQHWEGSDLAAVTALAEALAHPGD